MADQDIYGTAPFLAHITVSRGTRAPQITICPWKCLDSTPTTFGLGLSEIDAARPTPYGSTPFARTTVDLIRLRHRVREPLALSALRPYQSGSGAQRAELIEFARVLDVLGPVRSELAVRFNINRVTVTAHLHRHGSPCAAKDSMTPALPGQSASTRTARRWPHRCVTGPTSTEPAVGGLIGVTNCAPVPMVSCTAPGSSRPEPRAAAAVSAAPAATGIPAAIPDAAAEAGALAAGDVQRGVQ